ncbi:hypothetical protein L6452_43201 [Arctium lappa]|uniref:Uncharacterized protein n=1 Tax=Arctium lappa TaxID=4217 RepID=A0ACB8XKX9_ARCLA|nr:hypothetical protein L6452_43201 [Arctium lappa]
MWQTRRSEMLYRKPAKEETGLWRELQGRHFLCQHGTWKLRWGPHRLSDFIKGIMRVVIGIRHPLQLLQGKSIQVLRNEGLQTSTPLLYSGRGEALQVDVSREEI